MPKNKKTDMLYCLGKGWMQSVKKADKKHIKNVCFFGCMAMKMPSCKHSRRTSPTENIKKQRAMAKIHTKAGAKEIHLAPANILSVSKQSIFKVL